MAALSEKGNHPNHSVASIGCHVWVKGCKFLSVPGPLLHPSLSSGCTAADLSLLLRVVPRERPTFNLKPPSLLEQMHFENSGYVTV